MTWAKPLPFEFQIDDVDSLWRNHLEWYQTPYQNHSLNTNHVLSIPCGNQHPGSFGYIRKNHIHEGIDLYAPPDTPVYAVEDGVVVSILDFTGEKVGSPWWHETQSVMIEGASGVVNLGEITPLSHLKIGQYVEAGTLIGHLKTVLKKFKGRPQTMLHLELYQAGQRESLEWKMGSQPLGLMDPTPHLRLLAKQKLNHLFF